MYNSYLYLQISVYFNFIYIFFFLLITLVVYYFTQYWTKQLSHTIHNITQYLRYTILISLGVSSILHIFTLYNYVTYVSKISYLSLYNYSMFVPFIQNTWFFSFFNFSLDFFGLILLFLAYIVGFISIFVLDTRLNNKNIKYLFSFNIFIIIVYLFTTTTNIILFFVYYELLLMPSFLFVYFVSPSKRAVQASVYFIVWTQIGSLIVLFAIAYLIKLTAVYDLNYIRSFNFNKNESYLLYLLFFLGFGVKVPIWPFHYWLTKTHVEAPSGFSIYLSGFLVKTAIYGFYKLTNVIYIYVNTSIFITICIMGIVDASLKMWGQTDLKKLVAYGTIQEMNIIYLVFCWGDANIIGAGIFFCITHAFLSALMFYLVDCLYRRYHTRSLIEINGILHLNPNLALSILLMLIFFAGLPGTLKFTVEFYIFSSLMVISPFITFFVMIVANVIGLIGFSKCWFNSVFGLHKKWINLRIVDLSIKEIYIISICFFFLIIFSYLAFIIF